MNAELTIYCSSGVLLRYIYVVKRIYMPAAILALSLSGTVANAHTTGVSAIHEVAREVAPSASLDVVKDPTGGFNVHLMTTGFAWRPENASMMHANGEGHAHVYLDGRKIMRIYNEWFHLNTFQFATQPGEQLLTVELVGNDHAPYTTEGMPIGAEQLIDVPADEIQPQDSIPWKLVTTGAIVALLLGATLVLFTRTKRKL